MNGIGNHISYKTTDTLKKIVSKGENGGLYTVDHLAEVEMELFRRQMLGEDDDPFADLSRQLRKEIDIELLKSNLRPYHY